MTYHLAKQIFTEALDHAPADRPAFLDEACGDDTDLRAEVESLLQRQASTIQDPTRIPIAGEYHRGDIVGPFTIRDQLGSGGMGAVYLADQVRPVRRQVALKVIKPGFDTSNTLARFQAERQALAMMDHPGIARVLEAGATDTGRPWFAMEYIKGLNLNAYCNDNRLDTRRRLELFIQVCDAIQHAHQKGVIHRDLKPGNLLVSRDQHDRLQVKIIDFGIAKAVSTPLTDLTLHTSIGQLVGTLSYMSPEQVRGSDDIDTRTDVYSLGVILYELLSGRVPFALETTSDSNQESLKHSIQEVEPPKPSTNITSMGGEAATNIAKARRTNVEDLQKQLKKELEWIPLKALRKDRTERYSSPEALRDDVQRYLNREPLEAGPPSKAYRVKKYLRRHKVQVTTAASFILLMISATVISLVLWLEAVQAQDEAREQARQADMAMQSAVSARNEAKQQAERAEYQRQTADRAINFIDDMLRDPVQKVLPTFGDMTQTAMQNVQSITNLFNRDTPKLRETVQAMEGMVQTASDRLGGQFGDTPAYEATIRNALGHFQLSLGNAEAAREEIERAMILRRRALGDDHPDTIKSLVNMGYLLWYLGEYAPAADFHREVLETRRKVLVADDPLLREAVDTLGKVLYQRGTDLAREGQYQDAMDWYREAVGVYSMNWGPAHPATKSMIVAMDSLLETWNSRETALSRQAQSRAPDKEVDSAPPTGSRSRPPGSRPPTKPDDTPSVDVEIYTQQEIDEMDSAELRLALITTTQDRQKARGDAVMTQKLTDQFGLLMTALKSKQTP
ncbi:MAG: serine/threonine-protein kinase [Phycisphaerales bacterium]|nr:serine/threonine-protein kinase [Phycisphaerales bacterium]